MVRPRLQMSRGLTVRAGDRALYRRSTINDAGAERFPAPSIANTSIVFRTPIWAYRIARVWPPPIGWSCWPFRNTS